MKTILHASLLVFLCGLLLTPAAHADPKLLVPLYPGAVPDLVATDNYHAYFLSKDPIEKVRAYYEARVGKLADTSDRSASVNDAQALMCPLNAVTICLGKILMPQGRVAGYLKDVTEAYDAGVRLEAKRRAPQEAAPINQKDEAALAKAGLPTRAELEAAQAQMLAEMNRGLRESGQDPEKIGKIGQMSDLFEGLKTEVTMQRHSPDELLAIYAKYQPLETAVYPYKKIRGGLASYDRWLLARDKKAFAPAAQDSNKDRQQYAEQLQQLYMAGKFDEAKKLTDRMTANINQDHWNDWLAFLEELDANAYRTRIVIGVDPRSWGGKR